MSWHAYGEQSDFAITDDQRMLYLLCPSDGTIYSFDEKKKTCRTLKTQELYREAAQNTVLFMMENFLRGKTVLFKTTRMFDA